MPGITERILVVADELSQADASDPYEVGVVIDAACDELRALAAEIEAGERGVREASRAGPLVDPGFDPDDHVVQRGGRR